MKRKAAVGIITLIALCNAGTFALLPAGSVMASDGRVVFEQLDETPEEKSDGAAGGQTSKSSKEAGQTILDGISIGGTNVSGMTRQQAEAALSDSLKNLQARNITLRGRDTEKSLSLTAGELGLTFDKDKVLDEALSFGQSGNVISRYKEKKDAEEDGANLTLPLTFDEKTLTTRLKEESASFTTEAVDYQLTRKNGAFQVIGGQNGYQIDIPGAVKSLDKLVADGWSTGETEVALSVIKDEAKGDPDSLKQVKDVLGTFTTSYKTSGSARSANIANGCRLVQGHTIYPGEEFSVLDHLVPFTEGNGYELAGSYSGGEVVDSLGGGICQVSTTLYNAVLRSELEVSERYNHSMIVGYVDPSEDAAIAESSGKDFKFVNNTDYPIYIEGSTGGKQITFTVYGVESRDPGRKVTYVSETLSTTPSTEEVVADPAQPVGVVAVTPGHTGYTAQLWKVVTVNGKEESREVINSSKYKMTPRKAVVGTATADPNVANMINSAVATGSVDQCKAAAGAASGSSAAQQELAAAMAGGDPAAIAAAQAKLDQENANLAVQNQAAQAAAAQAAQAAAGQTPAQDPAAAQAPVDPAAAAQLQAQQAAAAQAQAQAAAAAQAQQAAGQPQAQ